MVWKVFKNESLEMIELETFFFIFVVAFRRLKVK